MKYLAEYRAQTKRGDMVWYSLEFQTDEATDQYEAAREIQPHAELMIVHEVTP